MIINSLVSHGCSLWRGRRLVADFMDKFLQQQSSMRRFLFAAPIEWLTFDPTYILLQHFFEVRRGSIPSQGESSPNWIGPRYRLAIVGRKIDRGYSCIGSSGVSDTCNAVCGESLQRQHKVEVLTGGHRLGEVRNTDGNFTLRKGKKVVL